MSPSVAVTFALPEADIVIDVDSRAGIELAKLSLLVWKSVTGVMYKKQEADSKSISKAWMSKMCWSKAREAGLPSGRAGGRGTGQGKK